MHPLLFLPALCLGIASAAPQPNQSIDEQWYQWKATHRKLYGVVGNTQAAQRDPCREGSMLAGVHSRE